MLVSKNRIKVKLLYLRILINEIRELQYHSFQKWNVSRLLSPITFKQRITFYLLYHLTGIPFAQRNYPEGNVFQHLNQYPSQTEHQYRPELSILSHANDNFYSGASHFLHGHAIYFRLR